VPFVAALLCLGRATGIRNAAGGGTVSQCARGAAKGGQAFFKFCKAGLGIFARSAVFGKLSKKARPKIEF